MKKVGAHDYYYFGGFRVTGVLVATVTLELYAYNTSTKVFIG